MKTLLYLPLFCFFLLLSCTKTEVKSNQKEILGSVTVAGVPAATVAYDAAIFIYTITLPIGSSSKALSLNIAVSPGATILPNPAIPGDYTNPVLFTVTAEDGSKQTYTVRANVLKSSAKNIDNPTVDGVVGASTAFDAATSSYTVTIPGGTDLTAVKFTFAVPAGATAKPASGSLQNFTNPVTYTITAEDGSTQTFTVRVVYRTTWATNQDRYDAIRVKAQRVSGVTLSTGIPRLVGPSVIDAEAAYIINTAEFNQTYADQKAVVWAAIDKINLDYYAIELEKATGNVTIYRGNKITLDQSGNLRSYFPVWNLYYSK